MHRSFVITGIAIMLMAVASFFMIKDSTAEREADEPAKASEEVELSLGGAAGE
jgi:hypothetical protein